MIRIALAAIALTAAASAMPSDLPWDTYACQNGKTLEVKFLSDGLAIGIRIGGDDDTSISLVPADDVKQAGFKDGDYNGPDDALLILKDGAITVTGPDVLNAPYENCVAAPMVPPAG